VRPRQGAKSSSSRTIRDDSRRPASTSSPPKATATPKSGESVKQPARPVAPAAPTLARDLVGRQIASVVVQLGERATQSASRYGYDTSRGDRLYVDFSGDRITAVSNPNLPLSEIVAPKKAAATAPTKPIPPGTPNGAVAKCGDGNFVYAASNNTCSGHDGVAELDDGIFDLSRRRRSSHPAPTAGPSRPQLKSSRVSHQR
jgi:hypothetical protein